jgi:hypothetical protein
MAFTPSCHYGLQIWMRMALPGTRLAPMMNQALPIVFPSEALFLN